MYPQFGHSILQCRCRMRYPHRSQVYTVIDRTTKFSKSPGVWPSCVGAAPACPRTPDPNTQNTQPTYRRVGLPADVFPLPAFPPRCVRHSRVDVPRPHEHGYAETKKTCAGRTGTENPDVGSGVAVFRRFPSGARRHGIVRKAPTGPTDVPGTIACTSGDEPALPDYDTSTHNARQQLS